MLWAWTVLLSLMAFAENQREPIRHFTLIGGSGDPPGPSTLFDSEASHAAKYFGTSTWNSRVAFDGGHSETERIVRKGFPNSTPVNFSEESYQETVNFYLNEIRAGRISKGDQLMVMIGSHGHPQSSGQLSHEISTGYRGEDGRSLKGGRTVSLDALAELSQLAEERGIQLAIVDISCHSGASLALSNSRTCVLTATGPDSLGYGGKTLDVFGNAFVSRFKAGKNLEEIFHEARDASRDLSFPMISSGPGREVGDLLYPLLRRFQNYQRGFDDTDKFSEDIRSSVEARSCEQEFQDVEKLLQFSREVEGILTGENFESFRRALQEYANYRASIQQRLLAMKSEDKVKVCRPNGECDELTRSWVAGQNQSGYITRYQKLLEDSTTEEERERNRQWLGYYQNWTEIRNRLLTEAPDLARAGLILSGQEVIQQTYALAYQVSLEGRRLYSAMVRMRPPTTNPCRDFKL